MPLLPAVRCQPLTSLYEMEKLRPLHSLHQNICSATLPPAFAASFLRKSTTTPQELQWNVVVGVRPSRDHQFIWYETLLDVMGIEKVFTVSHKWEREGAPSSRTPVRRSRERPLGRWRCLRGSRRGGAGMGYRRRNWRGP